MNYVDTLSIPVTHVKRAFGRWKIDWVRIKTMVDRVFFKGGQKGKLPLPQDLPGPKVAAP